MPNSKVSTTSLSVLALWALNPSGLQAAVQTPSPGATTNLTDGLLAQLLYLPAGLLLAAVLVELFARAKESGSLHRGVFVILIGALICSIAALGVTIALPAKAAGLSGSPFLDIGIGAAFTGLTLLACVAKWLCFGAHRAEKKSKSKSKKRGRGRGRRRSNAPDLRLVSDLGYGAILVAAVAALFASPFFAKPVEPTSSPVAESPETNLDADPEPVASDTTNLPEETSKAGSTTVAEAPLNEPEPDLSASPSQNSEVELAAASTDASQELDMFPDTPGESMAEETPTPQPLEANEPEAPVVAVAPKTPSANARPVAIKKGGLAGADTYTQLVQPILRSRCYNCHGEEKQKGDLRLDTPEGIRKGGKSGPVIIAGNVEKSYLFELISLDESEDDIMPPKGKPLSESQISWIGGWIREGAALGDGVDWPVAEGGTNSAFAIDSMTSDVAATDEAAVQVLLDSGVMVRKLSTDGKLLEIDFSHSNRAAGAMQLDQLAPLAENIHTLDLKRTKITDSDLAVLSKMPNLRILQLQRTKITDAALIHFSGLKQLESVNLYNTKVSDAGLPELKKLTSLNKVYLWSTSVTPDGARELAGVLGSDVVNMGE